MGRSGGRPEVFAIRRLTFVSVRGGPRESVPVLNGIFFGLILLATLYGAFNGTMGEVSKASIDNAKAAVDLAISLIGQMALWLGLAQVLQDAGLMKAIAHAMRPLMRRVFPDIPDGHPAHAAILLNVVANMIGLTNAATPFGIKAMMELNKLNQRPGVATNAMCLFLAINTSGVAVLPTGVIAIRAAQGADNPTGIFFPSILATMCSTIVGFFACQLLQRMPRFAVDKATVPEDTRASAAAPDIAGLGDAEEVAEITGQWSRGRGLFAAAIAVILSLGLAVNVQTQAAAGATGLDIVKTVSADWILPFLMVTFLMVGFTSRVPVYESVISGAKQGFQVGVMIIPFLVAILVAIGMFRASGAMDLLVGIIGTVTTPLGVPPEVLPMALIRPLSGSGGFAVLLETMKTYGPDSFIGFMVSVMSGSTETTFYVLAVYFGAIGVRVTRHTVFACLAADFTGMVAAVALSHLFY